MYFIGATPSPHADDGFTLVELMTVVLILGALVAIAIPVFSASSKAAAAGACLASRTVVERAAATHRAREGTSSLNVGDIVADGYLKAAPVCPSKGVYVFDSKSVGGDDSLYCSVHYSGLADLLFSPGSAPGWWKTLNGAWTWAGGWMTPDPRRDKNAALYGDAAWKDVTISTTAILSQGHGYSMFFRATQGSKGPTGYSFQYDPDHKTFSLRKSIDGEMQGTIASTPMPSGFSAYNAQHAVQITAVGNRIVVKVDGVIVINTTDSTYSQGQAGLGTWDKSTANFGNIGVTPAVP
ncbi:MAG: DUF1080 domain-containing protein [Coriobacteriia bacterium]|nr:DUF1080 domain-containing protein [Coriobacteriia bacterium]